MGPNEAVLSSAATIMSVAAGLPLGLDLGPAKVASEPRLLLFCCLYTLAGSVLLLLVTSLWGTVIFAVGVWFLALAFISAAVPEVFLRFSWRNKRENAAVAVSVAIASEAAQSTLPGNPRLETTETKTP